MKKNPQTKDETFWINTDMESHDAENSMAIRTILAHDIRMKKNIHKPRSRLSGLRIFMELCGPKVQLARKFHQWLTPKLPICCYVFKYFAFTDL